MKTIVFILAIAVAPFVANAATHLQSPPNLAPIIKALNDGDAVALASYLDNSVDVTILGKPSIVDKATATNMLSIFFAQNKAKSFATAHQGSSKGSASHYTIGELQTNTGTYRVSIYYKSVNDKPLIQTISIEK